MSDGSRRIEAPNAARMAIEGSKIQDLRQVAEASKYLMACTKIQTESAQRTERLTRTVRDLTWVMAVLTAVAATCAAVALFH